MKSVQELQVQELPVPPFEEGLCGLDRDAIDELDLRLLQQSAGAVRRSVLFPSNRR
jgi:hypothetical protein